MPRIDISKYSLQPQIRIEITEMLSSVDNNLTLEALWMLMDNKWEYYQCDNRKHNLKRYSEFYRDPVWILNGLYIEEDFLSQKIRSRIASSVLSLRPKRLLDWGGGLGSLARKIAELDRNIQIDIYEPYPSNLAIQMCSTYENIKFTDNPCHNQYDLVVCTDVLEHLPNPLIAIDQINSCLKKNAYVIFANCFYPVIKCHLPSTFYLRYSFSFICQTKGLKSIKYFAESYSHLYRKNDFIAPAPMQSLAVALCRCSYPILSILDNSISKLKAFSRYLIRKMCFIFWQ